jgi:hypothetical protein
MGDLTLRQQMQALMLTLSKINDWIRERLPVSLIIPTHPYKSGDAVWVKEWNVQPLKSHWRGPFVVFLSTPTIVKVADIVPWIHHRRVAHCFHVGTTACCRRAGLCSQETTRDHEQWDISPALVTLEAD